MEQSVITARPEQFIEECMALMGERRVCHLPVVERGKLLGIVS
jgi:CBS domain-containing protein